MLTRLASRFGRLISTALLALSACSATNPEALANSWDYNVCNIPSDTDDAMVDVLDRIHTSGYKVVHYDNLKDCDAMARTNIVMRTVRLCDSFFDADEAHQVATLYHELTHIYVDMGEGSLFMMEANKDSDLRWAVETIGHRQNVITLLQLGETPTDNYLRESASYLDSYSTAYWNNLDHLREVSDIMSDMCGE